MASSEARATIAVCRGARGVLLHCVGVALLLTATLAGAQQAPSREQEQIRRLRLQVQQLQKELDVAIGARDELQKKDASAQTRIEQTRRDLARMRQTADAGERRAQSAARDLDVAAAERDALRKQLTDSQAQFAELRTAHDQGAAACARLMRDYQARGQALDALARSNEALYALGSELLARLEGRDAWDALLVMEPFVQSKRVELENTVQDARLRLERERRSATREAGR